MDINPHDKPQGGDPQVINPHDESLGGNPQVINPHDESLAGDPKVNFLCLYVTQTLFNRNITSFLLALSIQIYEKILYSI